MTRLLPPLAQPPNGRPLASGGEWALGRRSWAASDLDFAETPDDIGRLHGFDGLGRLHEVWGPSAPVLPGFGEALTRTTWSDAGRRRRIEDGLLVEEYVEGVYRKTFVTEGLAPL